MPATRAASAVDRPHPYGRNCEERVLIVHTGALYDPKVLPLADRVSRESVSLTCRSASASVDSEVVMSFSTILTGGSPGSGSGSSPVHPTSPEGGLYVFL